jgi:hypothetical protein
MAQEIQSGLLTGSVILMHGYIHWAVAPGNSIIATHRNKTGSVDKIKHIFIILVQNQ